MLPLRAFDPRLMLILILSVILIFGIALLGFEITWLQVFVLLGSCVLTQWLCTKIFQLPAYDPKSAAVSGLSLAILFRADLWQAFALAGITLVLCKFLLRFKGKHIFLPSNFVLVLFVVLDPAVWISLGDWGVGAIFCLSLVGIFYTLCSRVARKDVGLSFLFFYCLFHLLQLLWTGGSIGELLIRVPTGSLAIFSFFMITDPKTTPNSAVARLIFAFLVAVGGFYLQDFHDISHGLFISLIMANLSVPFLNRMFGGSLFVWSGLGIAYLMPQKNNPR